jgi:hypothetical protein
MLRSKDRTADTETLRLANFAGWLTWCPPSKSVVTIVG